MFKKIKSLFSSKPAHGSNQQIAELIKQLPPSMKLDKQTADMMGLSEAEKSVVDAVIEMTFGTLATAIHEHVEAEKAITKVPETIAEVIEESEFSKSGETNRGAENPSKRT
jgi:hypothetical protein